jgi:hypothetical protein
MSGKDLIDAYKGDPAELADDNTEIAAAQAKLQTDTLTAADHKVKLQMLLGTTKLSELGADGKSVDIYSIDGSGDVGVENIPFASAVPVGDPTPAPTPDPTPAPTPDPTPAPLPVPVS